ncbi:MAG: helix-turn-helix domain-containing protein [Proteobacteria bacterium]|nr:helix-turn-helix domain-containing protein [Pseudomonadota bacterium]
MVDLERTSHPELREAEPGRMRHAPRETLPRHLHDHAFAAVVLSGAYVEAGDTGRHWMTAGDVLLHQAWESHLDRFGAGGAEVLVLEIADADARARPPAGRVADPDALARLAEPDRAAAARAMLAQLLPKPANAGDWPDQLACALHEDPALCLGAWASARGLHLGSISRGFRQVFGMTPAGYRLVQRTRRAIAAVRATAEPLSLIAHDCGFADQAHMTRAIRTLARASPAVLRRAA